ncbi:hypothetical protein UlMin_006295 [Ulmus minor]
MVLSKIRVRDIFSAAILFLFTHIFFRLIFSKPKRRLPPGPKGWPVVGCLPLLGSMPHVSLAQMAQKYGPIMYLKMGTCGIVVASKPNYAKAFLKILDQNFSNRPPNAGATHIAYGAQDFVFADIGPRWRLLRKLSSLHMLGAKSFKDWAPDRVSELNQMIRDVIELGQKDECVVVPEIVSCATANLIGLQSLSKRVFTTNGPESSDFKDMIVELMRLAGLFNIGDFIPSIAWMDLQGIEGKMKSLHNKFDALLTKMIEEHELNAHERKGKPDVLDIVMANRELTMTNVKALLLNLFIAGTDTTVSTVEWALAEMLNKPIILRCLQAEMDLTIGKNRLLQESDIPKLPYLQAVCKETFRKHPPVPLNIPRVAEQACEVNGYYIPKDTRLMVNVWAIGRDPEVWDDPSEFKPERFLVDKNGRIDVWGNDFELIPFGAGRRMCAGIRMGIALAEYILGILVHSFDWWLPDGAELNMDEAFGLVLGKAEQLKAIVSPRLEPSAYMA